MLFSIVSNPQDSANDLNDDLSAIHQWAYQWKMNFNSDPSKQATEVLFSCEKNKLCHRTLIVNGQIVEKMDERKHLGLILDAGQENWNYQKSLCFLTTESSQPDV